MRYTYPRFDTPNGFWRLLSRYFQGRDVAKEEKRLLTTPLFRKPVFWLVLSAALLGGAFRFYNPNWDFGHSFHPDERNILGQTSGIQPSTGYRVTFFAYGQLSVYLYRATGELLSTPQWLWEI